MAIQRKRSRKNLYIAISLIVILVVAVAAVVYANLPSNKVTVGVHVGDTFTYSLMGVSSLQSPDATISPGFEVYNQTDYYKVTITAVTGSNVSMATVWRFLNGTEVDGQQTIDLSNGASSDPNGFWALYPANLNVGSLLRPTGYDKQIVNATSTKTYADSTRQTNYWFIESQFYDVNDPTQNTLRDVFNGIYFDKATGMLVSLINISAYNNPLKNEGITWTLVNSTVWNV